MTMFRFTDLPPEIQLLVFRLYMPRKSVPLTVDERTTRLTLLRLNKQIHQTLAPHFYQYSTFHFHRPSALADFIADAGPICTSNLRSISYHVEPGRGSLTEVLDEASDIITKYAKQMRMLDALRITHVGHQTKEQASERLDVLDKSHADDSGSYWRWRILCAHGDIIEDYAKFDDILQGVFPGFTSDRKITTMLHGTGVGALILTFSRTVKVKPKRKSVERATWDFSGRVLADDEINML